MKLLNKIEQLTGQAIAPACGNHLLIDANFVGKIKLKKVAKQLLAHKDFEPQLGGAIEKIDGQKGLYLFYKKRYAVLINENGAISYNLN